MAATEKTQLFIWILGVLTERERLQSIMTINQKLTDKTEKIIRSRRVCYIIYKITSLNNTVSRRDDSYCHQHSHLTEECIVSQEGSRIGKHKRPMTLYYSRIKVRVCIWTAETGGWMYSRQTKDSVMPKTDRFLYVVGWHLYSFYYYYRWNRKFP